MSLRDLFVTALVLGAIPYILRKPFVGVMMWSWLAYMAPHRLCWGFAYSAPFSQITALATLTSLLIWKEPKRIPWSRELVLIVVFFVWMLITTAQAHYPSIAWEQMEVNTKILLMVFVSSMIIKDKKELNMLVWLIAMSIGFYGIKGGIFVITTGGAHMVLGPPATSIGTHGEVGMGMAMALPMMRYMQLNFRNRELFPDWASKYILRPEYYKIIHVGFTIAMLLTGVAIIGTHSRGAMLAGALVAGFFFLKSRNKIPVLLVMVLFIPLVLNFMPQEWFDRMKTIEAPTQEASARGRLNAWHVGFNMANNEFFGGGFGAWQYPEFIKYAPVPDDIHDAHSNYFEVLGEQGWVGFIIYMSILASTWMTASWVGRRAKRQGNTMWLRDLTTMLQVSIVGYCTSGAFIGKGYFELFYNIVMIIVLSKVILLKELAADVPKRAVNVAGPQAPRFAQSWIAYGGTRAIPSSNGVWAKGPKRR